MFVSWRVLLPATFTLALILPAGGVAAMEQPALEELESLLRDLGFDPGRVDGVVDDDTIAAIRRYQDFAVLTGSPEPSEALLDELRGVAAAFAALGGGPAAPAAAEPPPLAQDPAAEPAPEPAPAPPRSSMATPPAPPEGGAPADDKTIVPAPPPPPKLKPLGVAAEQEYLVTELPPAASGEAAPSDDLPADVVIDQALLSDPDVHGDNPAPQDAITEEQALIEAELAPHREALERGEISREDLARQLNLEGRKLLDAADYDRAILKLSAAILLDPDFAGAYSNRGTAYQRQDETELALQDFAKARELGFGGIRLPNQKTPLR